MTAADQTELVKSALAARQRAYAPYSRFEVGAALLTASGKTYTGCNVENASYGLTICAERTAVSSAIAAGETRFTAIAIASPGGVSPCGACRQILAEFCKNLLVILVNADDPTEVSQTDLEKLLPDRFGP